MEKFIVKNRRPVFLLYLELWASLFHQREMEYMTPSFHSGYLDVLLQKKNYVAIAALHL
jgi:hypothetical protein